ncbi:MAG TPA: polyprenyl diphosphate synthase [Steroidobacteraceae bacterium]|nr:polyprenyl diphosphate synthase [Steroidobacteraceae bacterium]
MPSIPSDIPASALPRHVAVIMDGNGRWAAARSLPRHAGHRAGVKAVRAIVEGCAQRGVEVLTLFAFSSENWSRPAEEVSRLMRLFVEALERQVDELNRNGVRLRFVGELSRLSAGVRARMRSAEELTAANLRMTLVVAVAYGGRWDITEACRAVAQRCLAGDLPANAITADHIAQGLVLAGLPDPDLFIRTGGEQRVSNFLLWNLAYTELYFTDVLWPDFDDGELAAAIEFFAGRERRFGRTSQQLGAR